jgi:hypothetical protein
LTRDFYKLIIDNGLKWAREGWGGYVSANYAILITPLLDASQANATMKPVEDFAKRVGAELETKVDILFKQVSNFYEYHLLQNATFDSTYGLPAILASRLIPKSNLATEADRKTLLDAVVKATEENPIFTLCFTVPASYSGSGDDTSISPAWREAVWLALASETPTWNATIEEKQELYKKVSNTIENIRTITPGSGAYMVCALINHLPSPSLTNS